jgi:hypothetical protein
VREWPFEYRVSITDDWEMCRDAGYTSAAVRQPSLTLPLSASAPSNLYPLMCLPWFRRRSSVKLSSKSHSNHTLSKESKSELTTAVQKPSTQKGKGPTLPQFTQARAHELFNTYCDKEASDEEIIGSDGLEKFCKDTQLDMEGPKPLILAWILGAKTFGRFSKEEWSSGTNTWK